MKSIEKIESEHRGHIGPAIAEARTKAGLSQKELAKAVGRHRRTISFHERCASQEIGSDLVEKIALVCHTSVDELWKRATRLGKTKKKPGRPFTKKYVQSEEHYLLT